MKSVFNIHSLCLAIMVVLGLTSCNREVAKQLQYVQGIIQERPDTALTILQNLPAESLKAASQKALYSLLYAKALDKNYIDTTDVSIIEPAVEYYSRHRRDDRYAEALFYKGRICQNGGDNQTAITYFNEALDEVSEDNHILLDLIHSFSSLSYSQSHNVVDALFHARAAYAESLLSGIDENIRSNLYSLAEEEHNNLNYAKSDSLLLELLNIEPKDSWRYSNAILLKAFNYAEKPYPQYDKALELFDFAYEHDASLTPADALEYKLCILMADPSRSTDFLDHYVSEIETPATMWWNAKISSLQGKDKCASDYLYSYAVLSQKYVSDALHQSLLRHGELQYRNKAAQIIERKKRSAMIYTIAILALLFLVSVLFSFNLLLKKRSREQIYKLEEALRITKDLLSSNECENCRLKDIRAAFIEQYRSQFVEIENLCEHGVRTLNNKWHDAMRLRLSTSLDIILLDIIGKEKKHKNLEKRLNNDLDGIISKLRYDSEDVLSDQDVLLYCYIILGFSGKTISFLMGLTENACRTRKVRLRQKIEKLNGHNRDWYLSFF